MIPAIPELRCLRLQVERHREEGILADETEGLRSLMPYWQMRDPNGPPVVHVSPTAHWAISPHLQPPWKQRFDRCGMQTLPHVPQLAMSELTFLQTPPQHIWPVLQAAPPPHEQTPSLQTSPKTHCLSHAPQWLVSVLSTAQSPPQQVAPSSHGVPLPHVQAPPTHWLARRVSQALSHAPQNAMVRLRLRHTPSQQLCVALQVVPTPHAHVPP